MKARLVAIVVNSCRVLVGAVYVYSGLSKVFDPAGMEHKLMAYLRQWDILTWTDGTAWLTAMVVALATIEFMLGIWLLIGIRRKFTTKAVTMLTLLFTLLTIYIYIKEPVPDCGCFGDAVKLTHGETLMKNIVLLTLCLPLCFFPLKIAKLIRQRSGWLPSLYAVAFVIACGVYSSSKVPLVDFTSYVPGYSFNAAMEGKFGEKGVTDAFNFAVLDTAGNDITAEVLLDTGYTLLAIAPRLEFAEHGVSDQFEAWYERSKSEPLRFYFLTSSGDSLREAWRDATGADYPMYHTDEGVLEAAAKSSPGMLLLYGDTIVGKWGKHNLPAVQDEQNEPVAMQNLRQKPQNQIEKQVKIGLWLFVPLFFLIFADGLVAGTVKLRRRSLKQLARTRVHSKD